MMYISAQTLNVTKSRTKSDDRNIRSIYSLNNRQTMDVTKKIHKFERIDRWRQ